MAAIPNCLHRLPMAIRHLFRVEAAPDRIRCHRDWYGRTDSFLLFQAPEFKLTHYRRLLAPRTSLSDILLNNFLPLPLSFQDELNYIAQRTVPAAVFRDVMRVSFHFVTRIGDGHRQSAIPHHRQVDDVVPDVTGLGRGYLFLLQNLFEHAELVIDPLMNMVEL